MDVQFKRDTRTGFLVSEDDTQYQQILQRRQQNKQSKNIEQRLTNMETELAQVKNTLQLLLSGK